MRPDFKTARHQLTGGMPTGSYDMSGMEFSVTRRPWDGVVAELMAWPQEPPAERDGNAVVISSSLDDALAYLETLR